MSKLWIFSEYFYPNETSTGYILTELAKGLKDDYNLEVVTSTKLGEQVDLEGVSVLRVETPNLNKNSLFQRIVHHFIITVSFLRILLFKVKKGDKVLSVTNPAFLVIAIGLVKTIKRIETILIVHDIFPENGVAAGLMNGNSLSFKLLKSVYNWAYSTFDTLILLGRDMKDVMLAKLGGRALPEIVIIENWADVENVYPSKTKGYLTEPNLVNVLFAGNIGRLQNLDVIAEVFGAFPDLVTLTFIGDGAFLETIKSKVSSNGWKNIYFYNKVNRGQQLDYLNSFDLHLVSLNEKMFGLGVPSKTYNILAAGKPILYYGPIGSEVDLLVREHSLGYSCNSIEELRKVIRGIQVGHFDSQRISNIVRKHYSKSSIIQKYKEVLAR